MRNNSVLVTVISVIISIWSIIGSITEYFIFLSVIFIQEHQQRGVPSRVCHEAGAVRCGSA